MQSGKVVQKTYIVIFSTHSDADESPGMYLRDDFLGGPTELRAPNAERAALFLDAALASRSKGVYEPALIFTLHVYQYSLAGRGGGKRDSLWKKTETTLMTSISRF